MSRISSFAVVTLALSACAAETEVQTTTQAIAGCPLWGCGENSPVMGPWEFHEGNTDGIPNDEGVVFLNFQIGNQLYKPVVKGSQLYAWDPATNTAVTGAGLTNGWFNVLTKDGSTFELRISKVTPAAISPVKFWVGPTTPIETYELWYTGAATGRLCKNPPSGRGEGPGRTWERPLEAMLFTGDRYQAEKKLVTASTYDTTEGWFNIACAGSALAKLHLNRHTTAGETSTHTTTAAQRQALLKMYVSDVCGSGTAYTEQGTPLHWQNPQHWWQLDGTEFAFEARWNENGALCLDTHRLGSKYVDLGDPSTPRDDMFGGECRLPPPCNGSVTTPTFPPDTYLVTAVPFDPNP